MTTTRPHRKHIAYSLNRLQRSKELIVSQRDIEQQLGYPLIEADATTLRGVIAGLEAVVRSTRRCTR